MNASCKRCAVDFANNVSLKSQGVVNNIIKRDLIDKGGLTKEKDKYVINAANDIFNILGPAFQQVYERNVDELTLRMLEATREIVRYYVSSATTILFNNVSFADIIIIS